MLVRKLATVLPRPSPNDPAAAGDAIPPRSRFQVTCSGGVPLRSTHRQSSRSHLPPRLQEALLLEAQHRLDAAAAAARGATEHESDDWRAWLVRSRIEAERGHAAASVAAYRRAYAHPRSVLFNR